jgi:hypothetical protein
MTGLVLVAVLVLAAYSAGYWIGRENGRRETTRRRDRVAGMAELLKAAGADVPGSPRLN